MKPLCTAGMLLLLISSLLGQQFVPKIKTNFAGGFALTPEDIEAITNVVRSYGISQVGEIHTHSGLSGSNFGIGIKSVETFKGREVTYVNLLLRAEIAGNSNPPGAIEAEKAGRFYLQKILLRTNTLTYFPNRGAPVRIRLEPSVPLEVADKIVVAFQSGKIKYAAGVKQPDYALDMTNAVSLEREASKKDFGIVFSPYPSIILYLYFTFDGGVVTVTNVDMGIVD
jgi:hypothetical protein